ncbi:MAG: hypothetical protein WB392_02375 [Methanotrichaceae archaeon]
MTRESSNGTCCFCGSCFAKSTMARHLKACKARAKENEESAAKGVAVAKDSAIRTIIHLQVDGRYSPMYWMHIEIPENATLKDLDNFLRQTWLECCGHLSSFEIAGRTFISEKMEPGDRSMKVALGKVIAPGMKFDHIYDFGTSTELSLKFVSAREGFAQDKAVRILARNDPPDIRCECGKPATAVCCQCICEGTGWVCDECAKKHECGEDMLLPVVNSPRVGMCGYTGEPY